MPEFNNLLEAEAYYKEESQARAEHREPDHSPKPDPESVHENTVFNPNPELEGIPAHDLSQTTESSSPYVESDVKVEPTYDPGALTPIPGTEEDIEEPAEDEDNADDLIGAPVADEKSSNTPKE